MLVDGVLRHVFFGMLATGVNCPHPNCHTVCLPVDL